MKSPRERAARALCRHNNIPEDTRFEGRPMWQSYLREVDVVLVQVLTVDEWEKIRGQDSDGY